MNVSRQDAFNLGWKLASVLDGRAGPELLRTYSAERHAIAQGLIDFDKEWSKIMASPPKDPSRPEPGGVDPQELQAYFVKSVRYTAGVATHYAPPTPLTAEANHQHLAKGFPISMRFHSAPVVRLADAKPVHLGHHVGTTPAFLDVGGQPFALRIAGDVSFDHQHGGAQVATFLCNRFGRRRIARIVDCDVPAIGRIKAGSRSADPR